MTDYTTPLPKDGSSWRCTWIERGVKCHKSSFEGLTDSVYTSIKPRLVSKGVSLMRALCPVHLGKVILLMEGDDREKVREVWRAYPPRR